MALRGEGRDFRRTLVRDGEVWTILEWCEPVDNIEDQGSQVAFLLMEKNRKVIAFANHVYISPEDVGLNVTQTTDEVRPQLFSDVPDYVDDSDPDELTITPQEHHQAEITQAEKAQA